MPAAKPLEASDDEIRDLLLRHLQGVHQTARSPQKAGSTISELQHAMRERGVKQQGVAANLDYLIQKGWVRDVEEKRSFTTPRGTTQTASRHTYKISDVGIDHLQGASMYRRPALGAAVNITNIQGVTIVGDGNVVNTAFSDLSRTLGSLRDQVVSAPGLDDTVRLSTLADIDSLQAQLQKPAPNRTVVQGLWMALERVVTAGEFVDIGIKLAVLIAPLLR